jgi:chemotaxis protein histidine kinase CheA
MCACSLSRVCTKDVKSPSPPQALFSRETELTRENAKLLAINIKLGGTGALPDSIVPFKSVITIANTRPHTQLELLTEIAAVEASNANLHALNTALTVENHLLKKHQDANREQGDELQRAKARAEADRKARAEAEREADGARKAREEADRRAKAAARDNSKAAADAAAAAAAALRAREAAAKMKEDAEARRRAVEGATSSPKRSPKLKKKNRKRANLVDGFYQLPSDKTRRFVRVVGDQVMVRGGGGFYSLEKYVAVVPLTSSEVPCVIGRVRARVCGWLITCDLVAAGYMGG